jgi:signal transduction histidine kinase
VGAPFRFQARDLAWLGLFAALAIASPTRVAAEYELLSALALFQILEPRAAWLAGRRGAIAGVGISLALSFLLVGVTGGVTSSYHLIFLVPLVSAATRFGWPGVFAVWTLAAGLYLSFLFFVDWRVYSLTPMNVRELGLRVVLWALIAFLTHQLVDENRRQARRFQATAEELAEANRNLQEAEAAVRRAERLAALGHLTAGLAHELRNPLGTMKASADLLLHQLPPAEEVPREIAGFITSEVDRLNALISRFLELSKPIEPRLEPAGLAELLDRAVAELARHQPPFDVTVYKNYAPDMPPVPVDPVLLGRAVQNLLVNAAQASPPGSAITLKTRHDGGSVEISVIDRGSGIDPEHRENIFNPFFTTKSGGVGLGLALVAKIVDEHGGTMAVESAPGEGSVFRILLPARKAGRQAESQE